jgi:hypothetical protein
MLVYQRVLDIRLLFQYIRGYLWISLLIVSYEYLMIAMRTPDILDRISPDSIINQHQPLINP